MAGSGRRVLGIVATLAFVAPLLPGAAPDAAPPDSLLPSGLSFFVGDLHTHTSYSDGSLTPADAYASARDHGLDFLAVTEHSESLNLPAADLLACAASLAPAACAAASLLPLPKWDRIAAAADAATDDAFVALRGFEQTLDLQGHLNVFFSAGWTDRLATPDGTMVPFWNWFTGAAPHAVLPNGRASSGLEGLGQFNHPNTDKNFLPDQDSWRWDDFAYVPAADGRMVSIEVFNRGSNSHALWYPVALDAGWHVAPVGVSDTHDPNWGDARFGRTLIVAPDLSASSIRDALLARHAAAVRDPDLRVLLVSGAHLMGDRFEAPAGAPVPITVQATGGSSLVTSIEIVSNGGVSVAAGSPDANGVWVTSVDAPAAGEEAYYYAKFTQADGKPAYTAPVWVTGA